MASSIHGITQSALAAAQLGVDTTARNIAHASTPGYNRRVVEQNEVLERNSDSNDSVVAGGVGVTVKRIYNELLGTQVQMAQTSKSNLDSYYAQIKQIDNLLGDPDSGLSPALQGFFNGIQELSLNPADIPSRQTVLSSAETLVSRFQSLAGRLDEIKQGVNSHIRSSVDIINTYAQELAKLNDTIVKLKYSSSQLPNDLLDQRDKLILDLSKEVKVSVFKEGSNYNVYIGNGQPLVDGASAFMLAPVVSATNPERIEVGYRTNSGDLVNIGESVLEGGKLGGLIEFRSKTLEPAQNALGRVAIGLGASFNAQHQKGFDLNGAEGEAFFTVPSPLVSASVKNTGTAKPTVNISDVGQLTSSDYRLAYDGTNYTLTRLSDKQVTIFQDGQTVDGLTISLGTGTVAAGDSFLIRPTVSGASGLRLAITKPEAIAAAEIAGAVGDNRNALSLAALQTATPLAGGTTSYQAAYSQLVSQIGSKSRELEARSSAAGKLLDEAKFALQNESGVNLDEEATNLLRYQQAYQAAAKLMKIASDMFDMMIRLNL